MLRVKAAAHTRQLAMPIRRGGAFSYAVLNISFLALALTRSTRVDEAM
jgi:hypothetical protein